MTDLVFLTKTDYTVTASYSTNLARLSRNNKSEIYSGSGTASSITFDFAFPSAVTVNRLFLGKILISMRKVEPDGNDDNIYYDFLADDNDTFTSPETVTNYIGESDLTGDRFEDYMSIPSFTTDYKYYRLILYTQDASSINWQISKILIGEAFDCGMNPDLPISCEIVNDDSSRQHRKIYNIRYSSINNTNRINFFNNLLKYKLTRPVVAHDVSNNANLFINGEETIFGLIKDVIFTTNFDGSSDASIFIESNY